MVCSCDGCFETLESASRKVQEEVGLEGVRGVELLFSSVWGLKVEFEFEFESQKEDLKN